VNTLYDTSEWAQARDRTLLRDQGRCQVGRLFGGRCHPTLDVHHVVRPEDGGVEYDVDNLIVVCHACHPRLEAMRRYLARKREPRRCRHNHRYDHARRECWARLNRAA
jgi:hypothetical protein